MDGNAFSDELRALAYRALAEWNIEESALEELERDCDSLHIVGKTGQRRFVLQIRGHDRQANDELRSELQCLCALRERGMPAPTVIPTPDGELFKVVATSGVPGGRQCVLQDWIDGIPLSHVPEAQTMARQPHETSYWLVGELLARLHNCLSSWAPPEGFTRPAWDGNALVGDNPRCGRFWELEVLTAGQSDLLLAAAEIVHHRLDVFGRGLDSYGLIHGNLVTQNIFATDSGLLPVCFDHCGFGWYLFDIAAPAFSVLGTDSFDDAVASLLEGYRSERELADKQLDMLPTFLLAHGLAELGWLHRRGHTSSSKQTVTNVTANVCRLAENYCS